jgi:deoxyribose-phosphate aldolase
MKRITDANQQIATLIEETKGRQLQYLGSEKNAIRFALSCIELTSLECTDNSNSISVLCSKAKSYMPTISAVCVYPVFVKQAKKELAGTPIRVTSVTGGFPSGQMPIDLKLKETAYALEQGADEIDIVIPVGKILESNFADVKEEIATVKSLCMGVNLKVILETGLLKNCFQIYYAALAAMLAGADFIKTSTGKTNIGATPEAFVSMLYAIKDFHEERKTKTGIKLAGGISDVQTTLLYLKLTERILGKPWLKNNCFRIGASKLADQLHVFLLP